MELRLANDEEKKTESGGLKLAGAGEANSLHNFAKEENPWDFDKPAGMVQSMSIAESAPYQSDMSIHKGESTAVKVGGILMYLAFIAQIAIFGFLCICPKIEIYANIQKLSFILYVIEFIPLIDAFIVNVAYSQKISLVFFAWFLPFLYPGKRDKHVKGGGIGALLGWACLLAFIAFMGNLISAVMYYGTETLFADEQTRTEVEVMFNQPTANGKTLGDTLNSSFFIEEAIVKEQGNRKMVELSGYGSCMLNSDNTYTITNKSTPTLLLYEKNKTANAYELKGVTTGNMQLNSPYVKWYQNDILKY